MTSWGEASCIRSDITAAHVCTSTVVRLSLSLFVHVPLRDLLERSCGWEKEVLEVSRLIEG